MILTNVKSFMVLKTKYRDNRNKKGVWYAWQDSNLRPTD